MSKGIFYMLTATEVYCITNVLHNYLETVDNSEPEAVEIREAINILSSLKPLDTEEVLGSLSSYEEEVQDFYSNTSKDEENYSE